MELGDDCTAEALGREILALGAERTVAGIIVQQPLPAGIPLRVVIDTLDPAKDIDGIHPLNAGLLSLGYDGFLPATAHAAVELLKRSGRGAGGPPRRRRRPLQRRRQAGRVPAPARARHGDDLPLAHAGPRRASCARRTSSWSPPAGRASSPARCCKPGAVVVDVGINVVEGRLVGDVDFESAARVASAITPVPGGVGPLTNAILLTHLVRAARNQAEGRTAPGAGSLRPSIPTSQPARLTARGRPPMSFPSDLDIARSVTPRPIGDIAAELGLRPDEIEYYGPTKAKVTLAGVERVGARAAARQVRGRDRDHPDARSARARRRRRSASPRASTGSGRKAAVAIRQPSLGPVFGIKGGAAGGGYSQIIPMEDFNLHLTGDIHAISAAHNLASAFLDNHLHHGNALGIDPFSIRWPRVVDISDRAIRRAVIGLGGKENGVPREAEWVITVASEVMAILALSRDLFDLRARLGRIVVATNRDGQGRHRPRTSASPAR